jgi:hypothetical protein
VLPIGDPTVAFVTRLLAGDCARCGTPEGGALDCEGGYAGTALVPHHARVPPQEHRCAAPAGEELPGPVQPLPTAAQHPTRQQPGPRWRPTS